MIALAVQASAFRPLHLIVFVVACAVFVAWIKAMVTTIRSDELSHATKIVWVLILLFFSVVGLAAWWLDRWWSRRGATKSMTAVSSG